MPAAPPVLPVLDETSRIYHMGTTKLVNHLEKSNSSPALRAATEMADQIAARGQLSASDIVFLASYTLAFQPSAEDYNRMMQGYGSFDLLLMMEYVSRQSKYSSDTAETINQGVTLLSKFADRYKSHKVASRASLQQLQAYDVDQFSVISQTDRLGFMIVAGMSACIARAGFDMQSASRRAVKLFNAMFAAEVTDSIEGGAHLVDEAVKQAARVFAMDFRVFDAELAVGA